MLKRRYHDFKLQETVISSAAHDGIWQFRCLSRLEDMDEVATEWRELEDRCRDRLTYFQGFDWCRGWVAAFVDGDCGFRLRIETVWSEGRLLAVWPLMVKVIGGVRVLQNLGTPHSQYCNLLCDDDHLAEMLMQRLLARIEGNPDCDVAVFHPVPQESSLAFLLKSRPKMHGYGGSSAVLDLSAYTNSDAYRAEGGKLKKRNRNRRRNHLARLGELSFDVIWPDDERFALYVRECAAMKRTWLRETGRASSGFSFEGFEDFLAKLKGQPSDLNGACISVLRAGDKAVAIEVGFLRSGHYYAYIGGFDWSLRNLSPGKVQMEMTVCWLIDNGVKTYDLLSGDGDYKKSWASGAMAVSGYSLPFSWKGRLYSEAWLPVIRPLVKKLYLSVPESMRRMVSGVQGVGLLVVGV